MAVAELSNLNKKHWVIGFRFVNYNLCAYKVRQLITAYVLMRKKLLFFLINRIHLSYSCNYMYMKINLKTCIFDIKIMEIKVIEKA